MFGFNGKLQVADPDGGREPKNAGNAPGVMLSPRPSTMVPMGAERLRSTN
jgi:hypothetical protein